MTTLEFRARLHALIADALAATSDAIDVADELLAEIVAATAAVSTRADTATLLRRIADEMDRAHGR